jgi:MFS family permease
VSRVFFMPTPSRKISANTIPGILPSASVPPPGLNVVDSTLLQRILALPRAAWILFFGTFLNRFGTFVIPFLTLYMTRHGYTAGEAGLAVGGYGFGTLCACAIGGPLADRIGRRKTIALSMFGGAVTMLLLSQAGSLFSIVTLSALNGLAAEIYRPASSALLADLVPAGERLTAFAAYRLCLNAGWAFGPATGGVIAAHSFGWLFIGDAFTSVLFGLVAWFALPHGVRAAKEEQTGWRPVFTALRRDTAFRRVVLSVTLIAAVFYQISTSFGLFVTQLGYTAAFYGAAISLNGLLVVALELPVSTVTRRLNPINSMAIGYILVGVGAGLNAFASTKPVLILAMAILTFGEMFALPVTAAYIADIAPEKMRGRYLGTLGLAWGFALIFVPGIGIQLLAISPVALWGACALAGFAAAWIISRKSEERT